MPTSKSSIRVGTGAGFSDDRIEPAADLAERGKLDYLVFECLAERTIARENLARLKDPERGYTPYLVERFQAVLPACMKNNVRIVTNMGAANPQGAARALRREAKAMGFADLPVAVVTGDDVADIDDDRAHGQARQQHPDRNHLPCLKSSTAVMADEDGVVAVDAGSGGPQGARRDT